MARLDTSAEDGRGIAREETGDLIASDKVEGTAVYGGDDRKIGTIESVMIGKRDGKVAYAVLSFGGFLGMGEDHYPVPWPLLTYHEDLGGYKIQLTEDQLKNAPGYTSADGSQWTRERRGALDSYYGGLRYTM